MTVPAAALSRFLDNACPDHHVRGGPDHVRAEHTAMRLLARYPDIAAANFYTAVVCGDLDAVNRALAADPGLGDARERRARSGAHRVRRRGRPRPAGLGTERLGAALVSLLHAAAAEVRRGQCRRHRRALLDHGANPNVYFMAGDSHYTPLVGVIGEGEEGRPGASAAGRVSSGCCSIEAPTRTIEQVIYNIHFNGKVLWFLELDLRTLTPASAVARTGPIRSGRCSRWGDTGPAHAGTWTSPSSTTISRSPSGA